MLFIRFLDRDMVMRYHWGLGVGHVYSHGRTAGRATAPSNPHDSDAAVEDVPPNEPIVAEQLEVGSDIDDPEFGFQNHDDDMGEDPQDFEDEFESDEGLIDLHDMYGESIFD